MNAEHRPLLAVDVLFRELGGQREAFGAAQLLGIAFRSFGAGAFRPSGSGGGVCLAAFQRLQADAGERREGAVRIGFQIGLELGGSFAVADALPVSDLGAIGLGRHRPAQHGDGHKTDSKPA